MKQKNKTARAFLLIILFVIDFIITGFATIYIWNNIMCQLFDLRTFTFWQGYLFSFVISWFLPTVRHNDEDWIDILGTDIIYTLILWLIGFLAVTFITF